MSKNRKTVHYDGTCDFCKVVVSKLDTNKVRLSDASRSSLPKGITKKQAMEEIHLVDSDGKIYKNIDVILEIVKTYKFGGLLYKIGHLPGIHRMLQIFYKIVASNRHDIVGQNSRLFWTKNVISLGFISGIVASLNLWTTDRTYPLVPIFDSFARADWLGIITPITIIALLIGILLSPKWRYLSVIFLFLLILIVLTDQSTLQPWVYQYSFMLGVIAYTGIKSKSLISTTANLQLLIGSIYILSGSYKLNADFFVNTFPWLLSPVTDRLLFLTNSLNSLGIYIALFEIVLGVLLLVPRTRQLGIYCAVMMHIGILLLLSPLGLNWNSAIWPWNVTMITLVLILFWNDKVPSIKYAFENKKLALSITVLFIVLPAIGHIGHWDSYLSFSLYSGNTTGAYIQSSLVPSSRANVSGWSQSELNVPAYPEPRVYKSILQSICMQDSTASMRLYKRRTLKQWSIEKERLDCNSVR